MGHMRFRAYCEPRSPNSLRSDELKLSAKAERSVIDKIGFFHDCLRVLRYLHKSRTHFASARSSSGSCFASSHNSITIELSTISTHVLPHV